ncbi:uncharacterized protein RHO17_004735 [Thomomys bottae]
MLVQMVQTVPVAPGTGDDNSCSIKGNNPNYDIETPCFVLLKKGAAQSSEAADLTTRSPVKARVLTGHDSQSIAAEEQESCEGREHKQPLTTDQINGTGGTNVFSKSSESVPEESTLPHYEHFSMQSKQHRLEGEGQLFQTQDAIHSYKISSQLKKRQRKIHIRICLENILKCQEKKRAESKVLSQLQCEEEQEREFCHWRLDDKKTNAHCSSEQNKERQDNIEGNQQPCACDMELETLRNALIQVNKSATDIQLLCLFHLFHCQYYFLYPFDLVYSAGTCTRNCIIRQFHHCKTIRRMHFHTLNTPASSVDLLSCGSTFVCLACV